MDSGQWTLCYFSKCQSSLCMLTLSKQMRITRLIWSTTSSSPHLVVKLKANSGDVSLNQLYLESDYVPLSVLVCVLVCHHTL